MAIKKNTDKNLNIIKEDGITDSYEKEGFFKDKPEIIEAIQSSGKLDEDTENQLKRVIEEYKKK